MRTTIFFILLLGFITSLSLFAQISDSLKPRVERRQKFDPARNAQKDLEKAIGEARKYNKHILLDVGGEWCVWCHRLDSLFIQNKDLEEYLFNHYVVVKINVSKENFNKEFLSKYPKVAGYPHLFVLNKNGTLLHSQNTGVLEFPESYSIKGHDKKKVFAFLKKWAK